MQALHFKSWHIIILHPDCTCVAVSGNAHYAKDKPGYSKRLETIEFDKLVWNETKKLALIGAAFENPITVLPRVSAFGKPTQYVQPYRYGHDASKNTALWLHKLPKLIHNDKNYILPRYVNGKPRWGNQTDSGQNNLTPSDTRKRDRAKTYNGIGQAIVEQWGIL